MGPLSSTLGPKRSAAIAALAAVTLLAGLSLSRLTPHEAIGGQTAREMIASGDWLALTIDGQPWLEKPPLGTWAEAVSGWLFGRVSETSSRLPSALAAMALCLGVGLIASRRFGPTVGLFAGVIQATMPWLVLRGRLAEVDVMLAALIVGAMAALDRLRQVEIFPPAFLVGRASLPADKKYHSPSILPRATHLLPSGFRRTDFPM